MANLLEKASIILTPTAYDDAKVLTVIPDDASGDFDFSRGSAATRVNAQGLVEDVQILSSNLVQNGDFSEIGSEEVTNGNFSQEGSELITNGDFATDTDWTKGTGWSIGGGKAISNGTSGNLYQVGTVTPNKQYKIEATVSNYVSGNAEVSAGAVPRGQMSANGTYTFYQTASTTSNFFVVSNSFNGSIDNVSVKEVGQGWTLGSGWSIGEDKAIHTGAQSLIGKVNLLTIGKSYKITFDLSGADGSNYARLIPSQYPNGGNYTSDGTITVYTKTLINHLYIYAVGDISITNISVKEVGQNWELNTGWEIGNNLVTTDGTINSNIYQDAVTTIGQTYKYSFDVLNSGVGVIDGRFRNGGGFIKNFSSEGTYTGTFVAYNTLADFTTLSGNTASFSITNISVIEITDDTNLPRINYSGFTYQDALGSELITSGNDTSNIVGLADNQNINIQTSFLTIGKTYKIDFEIYDYVEGSIFLLRPNDLGVGTAVSANGTYTYTIVADSSTSLIFRTNGLSTTLKLKDVSVKEYLGQEVVPDSGCGAWLFEPESTNRVQQSENYNQTYWNFQQVLVTNNNIISPDGELNGSKVVANTNNSNHYFDRISYSAIPSTTHTYSFFVKNAGADFVQISTSTGFFARYQNFNLSNGTKASGDLSLSNYSSSIKDYGNGWYRISLTADSNSSGSARFLCVPILTDTTRNPIFTGNGTDGFYTFGHQVESANSLGYNGEYATSYIPTEGTIKTRNQDLCTNGGDVSLINSSEGVLYAEIEKSGTGTYRLISLNSGAANNSVTIGFHQGNSNTFYFRVASSNGTVTYTTFPIDYTGFNKIALKYKSGEISAFVNGTKKVQSSATFSFASPLNELAFDYGAGGLPFFGNTKALGVWKEALTDAELRSLTYPTPTAATFDLDFNTIATDFTFTRNSEATFVNAQGLIQSTNELGAEEITNGSFDTDSGWSKQAGWTISGGTANANMILGGNGNIYQSALVVGKTYELTFTISNYIQGNIRNVSQASNLWTEYNSNGTFTERFVAINANLFMNATVTESTQLSIDNVSVKEYITETNTPRLDYSTGAEAFLLEPQSTNLIQYSEDFSATSWTETGVTSTLSATELSPNGFDYSTSLVGDVATSSTKRTRNSHSTTLLTAHSFSVYVKADSRNYIQLVNSGDAQGYANFDIANGIVGTLGSKSTSKITSLSNGWFRCELTTDATAVNGQFMIYLADNNISNFASSSSGTEGVYIWGAQLEELSYATSLIPTSGTTVTRNQELCVDATPVINSEEGVLYAEISALASESISKRISISDGTLANRITLSLADNVISGFVNVNNVTAYTFYEAGQNITNFNKIAIKYKQNNFCVFINGFQYDIDTNGSTFTANTLNTISFSGATSLNPFFGNTKGLKYYPKALSDVELQDLTTI